MSGHRGPRRRNGPVWRQRRGAPTTARHGGRPDPPRRGLLIRARHIAALPWAQRLAALPRAARLDTLKLAARLETLLRAGRRSSVRARLGVAAAVVAVAAAGAATIISTGVLAGPSGGSPGGARAVPPNQAYVAPPTVISAWARAGAHGQNQRPNSIVPTPVPSVTLPAGVPTSVPPSATTPSPALEAATSPQFGTILVDPAGMTVYHPAGGCACDSGYSPLLTHRGQSLVLPILLKGRIGTVTRSDGTLQVTFDGWPLYVFAGDRAQGDTNGDGAHWQVIQVS